MENADFLDAEYVTFSVRVPKPLAEALQDEGVKEFRRKRSLNMMITKILFDRYTVDQIPNNNQDAEPKTKRTKQKSVTA